MSEFNDDILYMLSQEYEDQHLEKSAGKRKSLSGMTTGLRRTNADKAVSGRIARAARKDGHFTTGVDTGAGRKAHRREASDRGRDLAVSEGGSYSKYRNSMDNRSTKGLGGAIWDALGGGKIDSLKGKVSDAEKGGDSIAIDAAKRALRLERGAVWGTRGAAAGGGALALGGAGAGGYALGHSVAGRKANIDKKGRAGANRA